MKGQKGNTVISGLGKVSGSCQVISQSSSEDDENEQFDITIIHGQRIFTPSQSIVKDPYSINDDAAVHIGSDYWI